MQFINHTPFPALAFQGIDQNDQSFHSIALRQTLTWDETGELQYPGDQAPLCEADVYSGAVNVSSVRQESDLCPYKPRCDVIVNAMAHAPLGGGRSRPCRFEVRLVLRRPDTPMPIPPRPEGLNPLMSPSREELARWRAAVADAVTSPQPLACLIDKTLQVTGERFFVKRPAIVRLAARAMGLVTLGLVRLEAWRLTTPKPVRCLHLRDEMAFGGECRIDADHHAADAVPMRHRLTPEQLAAHPDLEEDRPIAHEASSANPVGRGFVAAWYLAATGQRIVAAPQIEHPRHPITLRQFVSAQNGVIDASSPGAGLGVRFKGHPDRVMLGGAVDRAFIKDNFALPPDFDFAVWNAAWPDQQTNFLVGDEIIELTNLCAHDSVGAKCDIQGNTTLRLSLPRNACQLLVRLDSGELFFHALHIDTVIVEPDDRRVSLVWRTVLAIDGDAPIRAVEARMLRFQDRDRIRRDIEGFKAQMALAIAPEMTDHG